MTSLDLSPNSASTSDSGPGIREVGLAQRLLLWAVLASFVGIVFRPAMLLTIPFQLYSVYKLAKALEMSSGASSGWLVAMFIPLVSLICLLVLNSRATKVLKQAGIRVGLMGAKVADFAVIQHFRVTKCWRGRTARQLDALLTVDQGIEYQQNLSGLTISVVILMAPATMLTTSAHYCRPLRTFSPVCGPVKSFE